MSQIAVIGNISSISCFKNICWEIFPLEENQIEQIPFILKSLNKKNYVIIFLTEDIALMIKEKIKEIYEKSPSIVIIPTIKKNIGLGKTEIKNIIKKTVNIE
ncbi:MAG: V-type ATP synthase subunit F, partial [bacterium]